MTGAIAASRLPVNEAGRASWLRLARSERVGPVTFLQLMRSYDSAADALAALPELAARGGAKRRIKIADLDRVKAEMEAADAAGARMLCLGAADYPPMLAQADSAPAVLWALGEPEHAQLQSVAMVGARNASAIGLRFAEMLARDLGVLGWAVVSGLARGVDAAAHRGALESGTVAVLAGGVDTIWPPQNASLYAEIVEQGLVVSERPMGYEPRAQDFPRRNRIISGIARGVVVAEAAERSGSLITARMAAEQGRDVMAAPGSPLDPRAGGCNLLIREGATLVRHAEDVAEALSRIVERRDLFEEDTPAHWVRGAHDPGALRDELVGLMSVAPVEIDELIRLSGAPPGAVSLVLLELDLAGRLKREPGGRVALAPEGF